MRCLAWSFEKRSAEIHAAVFVQPHDGSFVLLIEFHALQWAEGKAFIQSLANTVEELYDGRGR